MTTRAQTPGPRRHPAGYDPTRSSQTVPTSRFLGAAALVCAAATTLGANGDGGHDAPPLPDLGSARVVEWNCPVIGDDFPDGPEPDPLPGALVADGNVVWFVTKVDPHLIRLSPGYPKSSGIATCTTWRLDLATVNTGGLRLKPWGTQVFVRGFNDIQRVETTINRLTRWEDGLGSIADVAVTSSYPSVAVYTTGAIPDPLGTGPDSVIEDPSVPMLNTGGVVQRLTPSSNGTATVKRWEVGASVGIIDLSGIDVHPMYPNRVYFSEPFENTIGELDTSTSKVRRWSLSQLGIDVDTPRQLDVSHSGIVWVVTLSGHIVKLNPSTNEAVAYPIPVLGATGLPLVGRQNNPIGIDADGIVGFTAGGPLAGFNKVGFLAPGTPLVSKKLTPTAPIKVCAETRTIKGTVETVPPFTASAQPVVKNVPATRTAVNGGTFVEANIDVEIPDCGVSDPADACLPSTQPHGISSDPKGPPGSFYAAIGDSIMRVAHVSLPLPAGGCVTGNGYIDLTDAVTGAPAGTGYLTFDVSKSSSSGVPNGSLTFYYPGGHVVSATVTSLTFSGASATIEGMCKTGSTCSTFRATVQDNGWNNDVFQVSRDPVPGLAAAQRGIVRSGNVKIYRYE